MKSKHPDWIELKRRNREKRAKFIDSLTNEDKETIAKEWINENAVDSLTDTVSSAEKNLSICMNDLDTGWEMLCLVIDLTENKTCLSRLAAMHLENWLAIHGESAIERVEQKSAGNPIFARMLSRVYRNSMPGSVYTRVKNAAVYDGFFEGI